MSLRGKIIIILSIVLLFSLSAIYVDTIRKQKTIFNGMTKRKFLKTICKEFKDYRYEIMRGYLKWDRPEDLKVLYMQGIPEVYYIKDGTYTKITDETPGALPWVRDLKLKSLENDKTYDKQLEDDLDWLWENKPKPNPFNQFNDIEYLIDYIYSLGIDYQNPKVKASVEKYFKKRSNG